MSQLLRALHFDDRYKGKNIVITNGGLTATRPKSFMNSCVFSDAPIACINGLRTFEITFTEFLNTWAGSLKVGVVSDHPSTYDPDENTWTFNHGTWLLANAFYVNGTESVKNYYATDTLKEGDKVRVSILTNGELHYFINGRDIGVAASGLNTSLDYYAVAEVYGQCTGISINGQYDSNHVTSALTSIISNPASSSKSNSGLMVGVYCENCGCHNEDMTRNYHPEMPDNDSWKGGFMDHNGYWKSNQAGLCSLCYFSVAKTRYGTTEAQKAELKRMIDNGAGRHGLIQPPQAYQMPSPTLPTSTYFFTPQVPAYAAPSVPDRVTRIAAMQNVNPRFYLTDQVALWVELRGYPQYYNTIVRAHLDGEDMERGLGDVELKLIGIDGATGYRLNMEFRQELQTYAQRHGITYVAPGSEAPQANATPTPQNTRASDQPLPAEVSQWSVMQVCSWLTSLGIVPDIIDKFRANTVTGALIVAGLTDQDLSEMEITSDMARRSLLASLRQLVSSSSTNATATSAASYNSHSHQHQVQAHGSGSGRTEQAYACTPHMNVFEYQNSAPSHTSYHSNDVPAYTVASNASNPSSTTTTGANQPPPPKPATATLVPFDLVTW